jgi:hypothetical protein
MIFASLGLMKCNINFITPKMSSNIHELTTRIVPSNVDELTTRIARLSLVPSDVDELTTRIAKLNLNNKNMTKRNQQPLVRQVVNGPIHDIELNRVYSFDLPPPTWPGLSTDEAITVFKNGSACAKPLERMLCSDSFFPNLIYEDKTGYDYTTQGVLDSGVKGKLDLKNFTNFGSKFMPSVMIGKGRKLDPEKFHEHAKDLTYIFCDITDFPRINVVFKDGGELISKYPKGHIIFSHRSDLFSN